MSAQGQNIANQINQYVRNYAVDSYKNQRLNAILLQLLQLADSGTGGGTSTPPIELNSSNFSNATDCPLTQMNGHTFILFLNEAQRFLILANGEWQYLVGGGFRILIPEFNSTTNNYNLFVFQIT